MNVNITNDSQLYDKGTVYLTGTIGQCEIHA